MLDSEKPKGADAAVRALKDALMRRNIKGNVLYDPATGLVRVKYHLTSRPLVSIVIVTHDRPDLLAPCLRSVESRTSYENYEVIVVDRRSEKQETLRYLASLTHKVLRYEGDLNIADVYNFSSTSASGKHLVFMNDDIEIISSEWIEALLEHSQQKDVGAVGSLLLYPSTMLQHGNTVQHGGVVLGLGGVADHAFRHLPVDNPGYFNLHRRVRNCSAVTGAFMMIRKDVLTEVGGWGKELAVAYNDIDLCMRIRSRGYRIVYTPYALAYHHESATRGKMHPKEDEQYFINRWADSLCRGDPFYNINLSKLHEAYSVAPFSNELHPLAVVLELYYYRPDLRRAFPEAMEGDYHNLIKWAATSGVTVDSCNYLLRPYESWYRAQ